VDRVEDVTKVTVYSNLPEVELYANGVSLGKKAAEDHFFYFDVPNAGETKLTAVAGEYTDESFIRKVDTFNEAYRLREKGAILNWFDITEREGYLSLNDKLSDILATEEGAQLFAGMMSSKDAGSGFPMSGPMMDMMGGFTMTRLAGMLSTMGTKLTKEDLLAMNARLNQIAKP